MTKSTIDHPLVRASIRITEIAHAGRGQHSSEALYLAHSRRVAEVVASCGSVTEVDVAAGLLLGVLSDTPVRASELTGRLIASGADAVTANMVVSLVTEVTEAFRCEEKLKTASDRAKRLMLCDRIAGVTGGVMSDDLLPTYLAACDVVVDLAGDADPLLCGWLIHESNKLRDPNRKETE